MRQDVWARPTINFSCRIFRHLKVWQPKEIVMKITSLLDGTLRRLLKRQQFGSCVQHSSALSHVVLLPY